MTGDWLELFRSSAPYVAMFRRSIMVFHVPGHLLEQSASTELEGLLEDIGLCAVLEVQPVIVVSLEQRVVNRLRAKGNLESRAPDSGELLVDERTLKLLKQEAGAMCTELEFLFSQQDRYSMSVYASSMLFTVLPRRTSKESTLASLTGRVHEIDTVQIRRRLLDFPGVVCLMPLGVSPLGGLRYVPSEELAVEVARQLEASKLIFFTQGQRIIDTRRDTLVPAVQLRDAKAFVDYAHRHPDVVKDEASAEVLRDIELLIRALSNGTRRGHLIDPTPGALLQELYTVDGSGTMISHDLYDGIRLAGSADVPSILELMAPLADAGLLRRRSGYEVECICNSREMLIWKRDDATIGCASLTRFDDAPERAELGCFIVSKKCRGKGHGAVLLSFVERVALLAGVRMLFLLTTQTMQWFVERGFRLGSLDNLPPQKQLTYDISRSSKIYIKDLESLPTEVMERFTLMEVDSLD